MHYKQLGWGASLAVSLVVSPTYGGLPLTGAPPPTAQAATPQLRQDEVPNMSCLASTLCAIKDRIRWRTPRWSEAQCQEMAEVVLKAAAREQLPPALIVAVMINESTLDERAVRVTMKNGVVHSKDGGLMGIRCILDGKDTCKNGKVRGLPWKDVMSPATNIMLGAQALAYWRDLGGVVGEKVRLRGSRGVETKMRYRRCTHRDHPYWAHYNHGVRYIDHGRPRLYPHHIAVLYYALSRTMDTDTVNLTSVRMGAGPSTMPANRVDHPIGVRSAGLFRTILGVGPLCGEFVTAQAHEDGEARSAAAM